VRPRFKDTKFTKFQEEEDILFVNLSVRGFVSMDLEKENTDSILLFNRNKC